MKKLFLALCWLLLSATASAQALPQVADNNSNDFLEPEQAFKLQMVAVDRQTFKAVFTVAPGYYLYRKRIRFELPAAKDVSIADVSFPKGQIKQDPNFGEMEVFHDSLTVTGKLKFATTTPAKLDLTAHYQGCSEKGLCYSPMQKTIALTIPAAVAATVDGNAAGSMADGKLESVKQETPAASDAASVAHDDDANTLLKGGKLWLVVVGFFGFGLLLSLTPCVFPMIPILSGIIVGHGEKPSRMHAFNLSLAYTLGMAVSYTLAGIAAGLSGNLISAAMQSPWVLGSSAVVFVALAFSMFGFYELQLPSAMSSGVMGFTNRIKGGRFLSVFIMGILSALIVSPCVAAPLAGALLYIGQTHDVVLGGAALFSLSMGMGVPLLLVGASAGALLPKAGQWMIAVKNFFGVVMLGMAIWLITPVIPVKVQMLLWAALLIVSSMYVHALDLLPPHTGKWHKFWKGLGVISLLLGVSQLFGALTGSNDPLEPLAAIRGTTATANELPKGIEFKRVKNVAQLDAAIAGATGRVVMLDFYADWCASCKEYERTTFRDPAVKSHLGDAVLIQADVTDNSDADKAMLARFNLFGPPGIIFFDRNGVESKSNTVIGYQPPETFVQSIARVM